jgi:hypothetical protein
MMQSVSDSSTQYCIAVVTSSYQTANTEFILKDSSGSEIISYTPSKKYNSVVVCTPDIKNGETYTAYVGGSEAGSVEVSSIVSSIGNAGGFGGNGGFGNQGGGGNFGGGRGGKMNDGSSDDETKDMSDFDGETPDMSNIPDDFNGETPDMSNMPDDFNGETPDMSNMPDDFNGETPDMSNMPDDFNGEKPDMQNGGSGEQPEA